ncbi:MAG: SIR2 family protein [bacterium]|nr:SIR2 family protein [bacterium]
MKKEDLDLIINAVESGKCLAFLGAGACTPFTNNKKEVVEGLPTGRKLAETLAGKCQYVNGKDYDLLKVTEYFLYKYNGDREELEKAISREIQIKCDPRPIHTVLAQLNQVKVMITTNYDDLLEQELDKYRRLKTNVYKHRSSTAGHFAYTTFLEEDEVVLHKMHGSIKEPGSMVITQSDYIYYLAHLHHVDRGMPEYFRKIMIPQCTLLFLGYSLEDWNFQVIWEGLLSDHAFKNPKKKSFALMKNLTDFQREYWRDRNIRAFDQDLTEFAVQLAEHFNLEIPQMGIKKRPEGGNQ